MADLPTCPQCKKNDQVFHGDLSFGCRRCNTAFMAAPSRATVRSVITPEMLLDKLIECARADQAQGKNCNSQETVSLRQLCLRRMT